jgi:hypothetical protein
MTSFAENLCALPSVDHLARLELLGPDGTVLGIIPNQQGKAGALAVFHALALKHGQINATAAREGLLLFAEHATTARLHPGSHPNIDCLLEVLATGVAFKVRLIRA